jgi:hypothetical protein
LLGLGHLWLLTDIATLSRRITAARGNNLPVVAASLVISIAAVANATVSSNVLLAADIALDARVITSTRSLLLTANLFNLLLSALAY